MSLKLTENKFNITLVSKNGINPFRKRKTLNNSKFIKDSFGKNSNKQFSFSYLFPFFPFMGFLGKINNSNSMTNDFSAGGKTNVPKAFQGAQFCESEYKNFLKLKSGLADLNSLHSDITKKNKEVHDTAKKRKLKKKLDVIEQIINEIPALLKISNLDFNLINKNLHFFVNHFAKYDLTDLAPLILHSQADFNNNLKVIKDVCNNIDEIKRKIQQRTRAKKQNLTVFSYFFNKLLDSEEQMRVILLVPNLTKKIFISKMAEVADLFTSLSSNPEYFFPPEYNPDFSKNAAILYRIYHQNIAIIDSKPSSDFNENWATLLNAFQDKPKLCYKILTRLNNLNYDQRRALDLAILNSRIVFEEMPAIFDALITIDRDTTNQLLDKGLGYFLYIIHDAVLSLPTKQRTILANLINNAKIKNSNEEFIPLPANKKVQLLHIFSALNILQPTDFNINDYISSIDGKKSKKNFFEFNYDKVQRDFIYLMLKEKGVNLDNFFKNPKSNEKLNSLETDYAYTLSVHPNDDQGEIKDFLNYSLSDNFEFFINSLKTPYGKANLMTRKKFDLANLNYSLWTKYPQLSEFNLDGKKFTLSQFDRSDPNSIFIGSKTSSCTSIDGLNGESMAPYLLNTAINIILLKDEKGQIVGQSRCFIAQIDMKPVLVIDNIEINNKLKTLFLSREIANIYIENLLNYFKKMSNLISPEEMPVYIAATFLKFNSIISEKKDAGEMVEKEFKLLGIISRKNLYINSCGRKTSPHIILNGQFFNTQEILKELR